MDFGGGSLERPSSVMSNSGKCYRLRMATRYQSELAGIQAPWRALATDISLRSMQI